MLLPGTEMWLLSLRIKHEGRRTRIYFCSLSWITKLLSACIFFTDFITEHLYLDNEHATIIAWFAMLETRLHSTDAVNSNVLKLIKKETYKTITRSKLNLV